MKKQLYFTNNQQGFILPYVLFLTVIVFILVTGSINIYSNDIKITERHLQQVEMETLFQMGREKLKAEIDSMERDFPVEVTYKFPTGKVVILIEAFEDGYYELFFTINLNINNNRYTVDHFLQTDEQME